jgi:hypothetical protein
MMGDTFDPNRILEELEGEIFKINLCRASGAIATQADLDQLEGYAKRFGKRLNNMDAATICKALNINSLDELEKEEEVPTTA